MKMLKKQIVCFSKLFDEKSGAWIPPDSFYRGEAKQCKPNELCPPVGDLPSGYSLQGGRRAFLTILTQKEDEVILAIGPNKSEHRPYDRMDIYREVERAVSSPLASRIMGGSVYFVCAHGDHEEYGEEGVAWRAVFQGEDSGVFHPMILEKEYREWIEDQLGMKVGFSWEHIP